MVLFGCRKRSQDYLFGEEWEEIRGHHSNAGDDTNDTNNSNNTVAGDDFTGIEIILDEEESTKSRPTTTNTLNTLSVKHRGSSSVSVHTAFSQDQPSKDYVTHAIRRNGAAIWEMMQQQVGGWQAAEAAANAGSECAIHEIRYGNREA